MFYTILRFTQIIFHPTQVSPKLHLFKIFIQFFFIHLTYIAQEIIAQFLIITHKPLRLGWAGG